MHRGVMSFLRFFLSPQKPTSISLHVFSITTKLEGSLDHWSSCVQAKTANPSSEFYRIHSPPKKRE